jgi:hypothetical protein
LRTGGRYRRARGSSSAVKVNGDESTAIRREFDARGREVRVAPRGTAAALAVRMRSLAILVAVVISLASQAQAQAQAQAPAKRQRRLGLGLTIGGFGTFATAYLPVAAVGLESSQRDGRSALAVIPVAGAFIQADRMFNPPPPTGFLGNAFQEVGYVVGGLLVFDGVAQAAGLAMGIAGAVKLKHGGRGDFAVTPLASPTFTGVAVAGRF